MLKLTQLVRQTNLPLATFESLRQLWDSMALAIGEDCFCSNELALPPDSKLAARYFTVVISTKFSALLTGKWDVESNGPAAARMHLPPDEVTPQTLVGVEITFAPEAIGSFLNDLITAMPARTALLEAAKSNLQPNDAEIQSQFTVALVDVLIKKRENPLHPALTDYPLACRPVEEALHQQKEQEHLINQVISQIRHSLDLPVILKTAVQQTRQLLQADRLVIFQFNNPQKYLELSLQNPSHNRQSGIVSYEARARDDLSSVLSFCEPEECLINSPHVLAKYYQGVTQAIPNVEQVYALAPCLLECMRKWEVKAKLFAPIIVEERLWGLLIAHQCDRPRDWKLSERQFLLLIAEHLAVAIHQAQLYAKMQQQAQTLEQRVKERTQELQEAVKIAQAASLAKGQFLATMSHELKTPLTSIIGLSDTLLHWTDKDIKDKQQTYLKIIRDRGQHLQEIIDDILDLSELESKELNLQISEISLQQIANQTLKALEKNALEKQIELCLDLQIKNPNTTFKADYRIISKILANLASNGIKFTDKGGKVTLRIRLEEDRGVFEVEDTGIGIPESQQHLLFQKFQQLDSTYTREYQGIGLGLALTKQLVELHHGQIFVRSTVGVGSTFSVYLPILTDV